MLNPLRRLSPAEREQLVRLRRRPDERPATNELLRGLQRQGLVQQVPLKRPSGAPSKYREWSITPAGLEFLEERQ
jgi:hypothetical protein